MNSVENKKEATKDTQGNTIQSSSGSTPIDFMRSAVLNLSGRVSDIEKKIQRVDDILKN